MRVQDEIRLRSCMEVRAALSNMSKTPDIDKHWLKRSVYKRHIFLQKQTQKTFAASLRCRKWGLGIPIHIQIRLILNHMPFIAIHIDWYSQLVLNMVAYINYIALAIVPSWGESDLLTLSSMQNESEGNAWPEARRGAWGRSAACRGAGERCLTSPLGERNRQGKILPYIGLV